MTTLKLATFVPGKTELKTRMLCDLMNNGMTASELNWRSNFIKIILQNNHFFVFKFNIYIANFLFIINFN
jgi:hypothetical protein